MPQTYPSESSRLDATTSNSRTRSQTSVQCISLDESTQSPLFPAIYASPLSPSLETTEGVHGSYAASESHRTARPRSITGPQSNMRHYNLGTYSPRLHSERFRYVGAAAAAKVQMTTTNSINNHESNMHTSADYNSTTSINHNYQHQHHSPEHHPTPLDKRTFSAETATNSVPSGRRLSGSNLKNPRAQFANQNGGSSYSSHLPSPLSPTADMASSPRGDRRWRDRRNSNSNNTRMPPTPDNHLYDMSITATLQHTSPSGFGQSRGYFVASNHQQQQYHHAKTPSTSMRKSLDSSSERAIIEHFTPHIDQHSTSYASSSSKTSLHDHSTRSTNCEQEQHQHHRHHQHRGSGHDHSIATNIATTTTGGTGRIIKDSTVSRAPSLRAVAGYSGQNSGPGPSSGEEPVISGGSRPPSVPASRRGSVKTNSPIAGQSPIINHVRQLSLIQFEKTLESDEPISRSTPSLTHTRGMASQSGSIGSSNNIGQGHVSSGSNGNNGPTTSNHSNNNSISSHTSRRASWRNSPGAVAVLGRKDSESSESNATNHSPSSNINNTTDSSNINGSTNSNTTTTANGYNSSPNTAITAITSTTVNGTNTPTTMNGYTMGYNNGTGGGGRGNIPNGSNGRGGGILPMNGGQTPAPVPALYWSKAVTFGKSPPKALRAHTVTVVGERLFVFGGCDARVCFHDLYIFDADTMYWSRPQTRGDLPRNCRAHSATLVGRQLFVFGGGDGPNYFNHLYLLDTDTLTWRLAPQKGDIPGPRRAHTTCYFDGYLYLFGGGDGVRALNDVYRLNTRDFNNLEWKQLQPKGEPPIARGYHTATHVGSKLVVFGGSDGHECFSDAHVLDLVTCTWYPLSLNEAIPRLSHTSTLVGSYLFVIGGHDGAKYCNDVLLLNLLSMSWERRRVYGRQPSGRGYHTCVLYDSRLFVYGGYDGQSVFDEVWILELSASAYLPQIRGFEIAEIDSLTGETTS